MLFQFQIDLMLFQHNLEKGVHFKDSNCLVFDFSTLRPTLRIQVSCRYSGAVPEIIGF
jgi:hypothetical protein